MTEKKIKVGEEGVEQAAPVSDRELRWQKFLAHYATKNPVKFASKKANGEFGTIPASFK